MEKPIQKSNEEYLEFLTDLYKHTNATKYEFEASAVLDEIQEKIKKFLEIK